MDGTPAGLMAAWLEALLVPLVTRLDEQEAVIRDQAETIGRQGAELEAEQRARQHFMLERDELAEARQRERRRFWIILVVATVLALVAVAAPAWVR